MNNDTPQDASSAPQVQTQDDDLQAQSIEAQIADIQAQNADLQAQSAQVRAQSDELLDRLLTYQQEIARHRRSIDLLRALPLDVHQRIGVSLVQELVQAESQRAADQAVLEFPEFLQDVQRRAQRRRSP